MLAGELYLEPTVDALLVDDQPDWDAIDFEVMCSRCGYNLRLLPEPRCPECGLRFDWRVILDAWARRSDFLFEHNWRQQPIRSWAKTVWRSFRPFRFWRNVSIHDHIQPGPLWFLLLTSIFWFMVTLHGLAALGWGVAELVIQSDITTGPSGFNRLGEFAEILSALAILPFMRGWYYTWFPLFFFLGPLAALALLCSLWQTLGRCRVRRVQILRVAAYASTPFYICWAVLLLVIIAGVLLIGPDSDFLVTIVIMGCVLACFPTCLAIFLSAGLKFYFQLPRAWFVGITVAFVGYLFSFTLFAVL